VPRIQLKIMASLTALVLIVTITSGVLAERSLRKRELERIESSMRERALLLSQIVANLPAGAPAVKVMDTIADAAGDAAGARVTLIDREGRVIGDSDVSADSLPNIENHANRPEVRTALSGEVGISTRTSDTVRRELLYVAVPLQGGGGAARLAVDLEAIDAAAADLRERLLTAAVVGLAAALALSYALSWLTLKPVAELREVVNAIADGELDRRLRWTDRDELSEIASAINRMAEQLGQQLEEARAEKEQLEVVLRSMVEGVLVLDEKGLVQLANSRLRELVSVWSVIEGRAPIETIRNPAIVDTLEAAAAASEPVVRELQLGENLERTVLMVAVALPGPKRSRGTVAVFHDVTELRRLEQVRADFVSNASHELRTPITSIRGFADTLLGNSISEAERRSYLEVILRNSERMSNLIEDLLELSRVESRRVALNPGDVDLLEVARMLLDDLEPRLREAGLDAFVEGVAAADTDEAGQAPGATCAGSAPSVAWADRGAVEQILTNLIDNAVKYNEAGGKITVRIASESSVVRVSIEDTGMGIPEEDRGRIFERFYRVDKARSRALGGTGLGLAIVKHLVQAMGGEIRVESELGAGSCFHFTLPRHDPRESV